MSDTLAVSRISFPLTCSFKLGISPLVAGQSAKKEQLKLLRQQVYNINFL